LESTHYIPGYKGGVLKKIQLALVTIAFMLVISCGSDNGSTADQEIDRRSNGGLLRFNLSGKNMHDRYFGAQFTPRGEFFKKDNLQLYNYHIGSDKFPKFIISINHKESDLQKWEGESFPMDFLAFTPQQNSTPLGAEGKIAITRVSESMVNGNFEGELIHPVSGKRFPIRGEFKAKLEINQ
jgi:hypothetical protein